MRRIEDILRAHRLDYEIGWTVGAQPFLTPPGRLSEALAAAIGATTGLRPQLSTTGGTSDGRFIATVCPQVVEFGPTNATIHKVDECVRVADLDPLKEVYRRTLEILLPESTP
jgi:succinyl-diaminopimelate desuccinylase